MRVVIPKLHDFDYFSLKEVVDRWRFFHAEKLEALSLEKTLESFILDCLAEEGITVSEELLSYLHELDIDLLPHDLVMGDVLTILEKKHLGYVWRLEDNLFPEWGYWLSLKSLMIRDLVYLSADISPDIHLDLTKPVFKFKTYFGEFLEKDQRLKYFKLAETITSERMAIAVNHLMSSDGLLMSDVGRFYGAETPVTLKSFVAWVIGMGWELPRELAEIHDDAVVGLNLPERGTRNDIGKGFTDANQIDSERGRKMVSDRRDRKRHTWFKDNIVLASWVQYGENYKSKAAFIRDMMRSWENRWMVEYGDMGYFPTEKTIADSWMKGLVQVNKK